MSRNAWRIGTGAAIWGGLLVLILFWLRGDDRWANLTRTSRALVDFALVSRQDVSIESSAGVVLSTGDPVFFVSASGEVRQVGEIVSEDRVEFYPGAPEVSGQDYDLVFHQSEPSLGWLLETLLPPEKQQQVMTEIRSLIDSRGRELMETLRPLLVEWSRDLLPLLEEQLGRAIADHWTDIDRLVRRWGGEIDRRDLDRLMREVCWPIVQANVEPLADKVGVELWARVSIWRFGWRYLYDQSGLGDQAVRKEWDRFVREEAMPIIEAHTDDFLNVLGTIVREVAANQRVQQTLGAELKRMLDDPEFHAVLGAVLKKTLLESPRLRDAVAEAFASPEARRAFERLSAELEPTVDRLGVMIFGSADAGIDPDFARALRGYVLGKDRRWFQLVKRTREEKTPAAKASVLEVVLAQEAAAYPLRYFVGGRP